MNLLASLSICAQRQWGLGCHIQGFIPAPDALQAGSVFWQLVRFWVELGSSDGEGNGNPLQYSRLENPMDGGVW